MKADIWSLGIIFFQMIVGRYPYDSLTAQTLYAEIRRKRIFAEPKPTRFFGYTPTQEAYDFMRFLIVVDSEDRPDWRKVREHPFLNNKSHRVSQRFIRDCDIQMSGSMNCDEVLNEEDLVKSVNDQLGTLHANNKLQSITE